jgi:hypothetical protein
VCAPRDPHTQRTETTKYDSQVPQAVQEQPAFPYDAIRKGKISPTRNDAIFIVMDAAIARLRENGNRVLSKAASDRTAKSSARKA